MRRVSSIIFTLCVCEMIFWLTATTTAASVPGDREISPDSVTGRLAQAQTIPHTDDEHDNEALAHLEALAKCERETTELQREACVSALPSHPALQKPVRSTNQHQSNSESSTTDDIPSQKVPEGSAAGEPKKDLPFFCYLGGLLLALLIVHGFITLELSKPSESTFVSTIVALARPVLDVQNRFISFAVDVALLALFASACKHLGECSNNAGCNLASIDGVAALSCLISITTLLQLHGGLWVQAALGVDAQPTYVPLPKEDEKEKKAKDVGIIAMDVYFPDSFVALADLEKHDGIPSGKYTAGLGQTNMAVCDDVEDATSMALSVVHSLLKKSNIDPTKIGRIEVGTESLTDYSKSVKTSLMDLFAAKGNTDIEGVTSINACYGGTAALLNSVAWVESSAWDGRYALVVATDVAAYAPGPARPTGGAGAVAMLLGADAPLALEPIRCSHSVNVWDFYKPKSTEVTEYPTVDGHLANDVYLAALDACYSGFVSKTEKATGERVSIDSSDLCVFHAPYNKLVVKSLARMVWNDWIHAGCDSSSPLAQFAHLAQPDAKMKSVQDRDLDIACRNLTKDAYAAKVAPTTLLPTQIGNSYTASTYMGLASLITSQHASHLMGKRVLVYSYGSGNMATMFSLRVRHSTALIQAQMDVLPRLAARTQLSAEAYTAAMDRRKAACGVAPFQPDAERVEAMSTGSFHIAGITADHQRCYALKQLNGECTPAEKVGASEMEVSSSGSPAPTEKTAAKKHMEGHDAYQIALMKERCIALDWNDNSLGPVSKEDSHLKRLTLHRGLHEAGGMLHRAFSVLLFNTKGELLLQQRATEKITFADFWANTCCSHPLFTEEELEERNQLGVKRAAQRKLLQELGVKPEQIPLDSFHFVTRFHYAADSCQMWGEHEIDYVLIAQLDVDLEPNPQEVQAVKFVTRDSLKTFLAQHDNNEVLVSPWFRLLCDTVLPTWWDALDNKVLHAMASPEVHRLLDPSAKDAMVAACKDRLAEALANKPAENSTKKVQEAPAEAAAAPALMKPPAPKKGVFKKLGSIFSQLSHPDEVVHMVKYLAAGKSAPVAARDEDEAECFKQLRKTSRSFAAVIEQLHEELRTPICIFYLALRALDTVEDDMAVPEGQKKQLLLDFYLRLNDGSTCKAGIEGMGDAPEYIELLHHFDSIVRTGLKYCTPGQNQVIADITRRMGEGMAKYVGKESLTSTDEYDLYCHYVAGLVGIGLSELFGQAQCEGPHMLQAHVPDISNEMGLFLQKTNITRDYLEDVVEGRPWWPREVWSKYAATAAQLQHSDTRLACLNELVTDALEHAPICLEYLSMLRDPTVFNFCAVPQLMAIATLAELYDNPNVYTGVVKIRKGLALALLNDSAKSMQTVMAAFTRFSKQLRRMIRPEDPSARRTHAALDAILNPVIKTRLVQGDDVAVVRQVHEGKLRLHELENKLGDTTRAVKIRRAVLQDKHRVSGLNELPVDSYDYDKVFGVNCESVIGFTTLPVGVVLGLKVDGATIHVPMATTEGALVASTQRGAKALSGGVQTVLTQDGISRAPLLQFPSAMAAGEFKKWMELPSSQKMVKTAFESTSRFVKLQSTAVKLAGRNVFVRFVCSTGDAMGMNMAGKACNAALVVISAEFPAMIVASLSGNFCSDKKSTAVNWIEGRGKSVVAEAVISKETVEKVLKTTVEAMINVNVNKNLVGSAMAGAVGGFNAHAANVVTAVFLATGQDPAQVVESSQCITLMEVVAEGLHVSVTMPAVEVGTVGGGTHLAAQSACLEMLGVKGANKHLPGSNAQRLARVVAATVLAGEVSLVAALSSGDLIKSHMKLNRKGGADSISTVPASTTTEEVVAKRAPVSREEFMAVFPPLCDELVEHVRELIDPEKHQLEVAELTSWVQGLLEHAGPGGKLNRGMTVCHSFDMLKPDASDEERYQAKVLGWAVELLQAFFLVADDIMDQSTTRRGKPCWYTLPEVGLKAINDSFILEACVYILMKKHVGGSKAYSQLVEIMHECAFQTELGQALDLNTEDQGEDGCPLDDYTMQRVQAIAKHKTSYYSFYLPLALGMALAGHEDEQTFEAAKKICVDVGVYFQAQDDFLDCYGDPELIGKIGTDIESGKCSWLVAKTLEICTPEQRAILEECYGRGYDDPSQVARVKQLFLDLDISKYYHAYEEAAYKEVSAAARGVKALPAEVFDSLIAKVYKRSK